MIAATEPRELDTRSMANGLSECTDVFEVAEPYIPGFCEAFRLYA